MSTADSFDHISDDVFMLMRAAQSNCDSNPTFALKKLQQALKFDDGCAEVHFMLANVYRENFTDFNLFFIHIFSKIKIFQNASNFQGTNPIVSVSKRFGSNFCCL